MAKQKKNVSELGYAEAIAELEEILELLDGDDVDVDQLSTHVQRAAELIELCVSASVRRSCASKSRGPRGRIVQPR